MAPIRVALIGLSQAAATSWASEGHLPYLLSSRGQERYRITALLNSSLQAAHNAIRHYNLPSDTKAYASPKELAQDPDIDLVVCTTRVDVHYSVIRPSVEAGKAVFVEWPLAENVARARELAEIAERGGSRTLIGLQARVAPAVVKVKELLEGESLGKVLSSSVQAFSPFANRHDISEGLGYFLDKKVGGNPVVIACGHMIDFLHFVLGEFESCNSHTQIQRPAQSVVNRLTGVVKPVTSDVPDLVSVHGTLRPSTYVHDGASLLVEFRTGPPFPGTLPFVWTITCEKGEVRVTSERGPFLQSASFQNVPIQVHDFESGIVSTVDWKWEDWQEPLSGRSRNIAKLYDLFAEGTAEKAGCADFGVALTRHRQIDSVLYGSELSS